MAPSRYTELFFLDEATAFAAGHRPCVECRRADYMRFASAWRLAAGVSPSDGLSAATIDIVLHAERLDGRRQRRFRAALSAVPDGAVVVLPEHPDAPVLLWRRSLYPWSHDGYGAPFGADASMMVEVLTPAPLCDVLHAGYEIGIHASHAAR